jgi:hypothetical protein
MQVLVNNVSGDHSWPTPLQAQPFEVLGVSAGTTQSTRRSGGRI